MFNKLARSWQWVKIARLYRRGKYQEFLSELDEFEKNNVLSLYQLALRANTLLLVGRYRDSLALFSIISSDHSSDAADNDYIRRYAQAMMCDINGDVDGFTRFSREASSIKCSYLVKNKLPLT